MMIIRKLCTKFHVSRCTGRGDFYHFKKWRHSDRHKARQTDRQTWAVHRVASQLNIKFNDDIGGGGVVTVHGGWFQGSPSICIGNCFLVLITISEHWARRFPDERNPVRTCEGREDYFWSILLTILTCPMWRQFSRPMTSINLSPISWLAPLKSIRSPRLELLDSSPSFFTFFLLNFDLESPHMLVPPWVEGMLRRAMPCSWGPPVRGSDTPSHWNITTL